MLAPVNVRTVQIDSLVIMKIVKHVDTDLYAGINEVAGEACQGLLTGLVSPEDARLEITNCFPTARAEPSMDNEENAAATDKQEETKQSEMLDMQRKFRQMNVDYEMVGFYQAHPFGACFSQDLFDSMFDYQSAFQDGIVLIYDPVKTRQGQLSIRAYRLSQKAFELCNKDNGWTPEAVRSAGVTFETMFDELPITIKNSHLVNVMLSELALVNDGHSPVHMEMGTRRSLEKCLRSTMNQVDELNRSISSYNKYLADKQRHDSLVQNLTQKRALENEARVARGEAVQSFDDIKKMKGPMLASKNGLLDAYLAASETAALSDFAYEVTGENIAKLFLAEAIAGDGKERSSNR